MSRSNRLSLICTVMAILFLAVAAARLAAMALPLADPALSTGRIYCQPMHCWLETDPVRLLPASSREAGTLSPAALAKVGALAGDPKTRLWLTAAAAVHALPSFLLFLSLAFAFRHLGRGDGLGGMAAAWLRRAAAAAIAVVVAQPLADTIRATAFSAATTGRQQLFIAFDGGPFFWGLLLAGAVWISVWALEQAQLVKAELAKIV
jgi:hypothetical protein